MLIQKLKQYPKHSQYGQIDIDSIAATGSAAIQQNINTFISGTVSTVGTITSQMGFQGLGGSQGSSQGSSLGGSSNPNPLNTLTVAQGANDDEMGYNNIMGNMLIGRNPTSVSSGPYQTGYTQGGEYVLPDGTDFVGNYHVMVSGVVMAGVTHGPNSAVLSPVPAASAQDLIEYEHYIESGSTYKSNLRYVNLRDSNGILEYQQDGNNTDVIIELVTSNFKNRSVVSAIDTQFQYFKFPAQVSTTIDDFTFDESLLDIDVQQGILNDPYQGKLIRNQSARNAGLFFVQGTEKRKFQIKASSIWALKNNLPPFENIVGNISGKDDGENNYSSNQGDGTNLGYHDVTYKMVPAGIFDGYTTGDDYLPEDAFSEGNVYGKAIIYLTATDPNDFPAGLVNNSVNMGGPSFGSVNWTSINTATFEDGGTKRYTEFDVNELETSYIGISSDLAQGGGATQNASSGQYLESWAGHVNTNLGFDVRVGTSYLDFVQEAFRDWSMDAFSPWDIEIMSQTGWDNNSSKNTPPKNFLNGIKSTTPGQSQFDWGANRDWYYPTRNNNLNELDDTPWFKLSLPVNETTYKLFLNEVNITPKLHNANMERVENLNANPFNGVTFVDPASDPDGYNGYRLDLIDVFPNGIPGNTNQKFEIQINSLNQVTFNIYFIGLNWDGTGTSNTDRTRMVVVPNSISTCDPTISQTKGANKENRLKDMRWGFEYTNTFTYTTQINDTGASETWDNATKMHIGYSPNYWS